MPSRPHAPNPALVGAVFAPRKACQKGPSGKFPPSPVIHSEGSRALWEGSRESDLTQYLRGKWTT